MSLSASAQHFPVRDPAASFGHRPVVCTQNLENFGLSISRGSRTLEQLQMRADSLAKRIATAACDIIGVQEVTGGDTEVKRALQLLSEAIEVQSGIRFLSSFGRTNDHHTRVGLLYREDLFSLLELRSLSHASVPPLSNFSHGGHFSRGPLFIRLKLGSGPRCTDLVALVFHFKSKSQRHQRDSRGFAFELTRMVQAEALRNEVTKLNTSMEQGAASGCMHQQILVMGDRNSTRASASDYVLQGALHYADFRAGKDLAHCKLGKSGAAFCSKNPQHTAVLRSLVTASADQLPTYWFKGSPAQLDDILVRVTDDQEVPVLRGDPKGGFGTVREPAVSDHALLWARVEMPLR